MEGKKHKHTRDSLSDHFGKHQKVKVVFTKKDGTERTMICSLHADLLPKVESGDAGKGKTSKRPPSDSTFSAYDLENGGWRLFTIANIKSIEGVK